MGDVVGESTKKTKAILEASRGKVLVIDESYNLDDSLFRKNALGNIVEKLSGASGDDMRV